MKKVKKAKKPKIQKMDGLGPKEITSIRNAIRQVWQRSKARKIVVDRCIGKDGFSYCEKCKKRVPKVFIDHKANCGDVLEPGYILRMFVSSKFLQGWCKKCHGPKTKKEQAIARLRRKKAKETDDFF